MYTGHGLPEPPLEPPEPKVICTCEHCGDDINEGDEIVELDGEMYHRDCFEDIAVSLLLDRFGAMACVAEVERW